MAKFRAIVNAVRQAITGNATTADVLSGKTFMSAASPNEQTGSMTNNGAVIASLTADGQVYTIPAGYHNGNGTVTANVSVSPVLLWTNPDMTQGWTQNSKLSMDLSNVTHVIIEQTAMKGEPVTLYNKIYADVGDTSKLAAVVSSTGYERPITIGSDGITSGTTGSQNANIIYRVYGF